MSDIKHTPGKWEVQEMSSGETHIVADHGLQKVAVMTWTGELDTALEDAANARLIAASPQLLEALKELKQLLNGEVYSTARVDKEPIGFPEAIRIGNIFERADAAIKLAEEGQ